MMLGFLGKVSDLVDEAKRGAKILKLESADEFTGIDLPAGKGS
jgi:hypothetical protein